MNTPKQEINDPTVNLSSYQAAFVEMYFKPNSKSIIVLGADTGLGKTVTICALLWRLFKGSESASVLLLVPASLQTYFSEMLDKYVVPSQIVDRYRFREMLDTNIKLHFWRGKVNILSSDFAKRPDVLNVLTELQWDLVIVEESHTYNGSRAEMLKQLWPHSVRMILSTLPNVKPPKFLLKRQLSVVEWKKEQFGTHFVTPPTLNEIKFDLSTSELDLLKGINALISTFKRDKGQRVLIGNSLLRAFNSSPSTLENFLQKLKRTLKSQSQIETETDLDVVHEIDAVVNNVIAEKAIIAIEHTLEILDKLNTDSKLDVLGSILNNLRRTRFSERKICILTNYSGTLHYLAAGIENLGFSYQLFHGSMTSEARQGALDISRQSEEILIATSASLKGVDLRYSTDLVLYDIPASKLGLYVVMSRFIASHRQNIYAFNQLNGTGDTSVASLDLLRSIIQVS